MQKEALKDLTEAIESGDTEASLLKCTQLLRVISKQLLARWEPMLLLKLEESGPARFFDRQLYCQESGYEARIGLLHVLLDEAIYDLYIVQTQHMESNLENMNLLHEMERSREYALRDIRQALTGRDDPIS